jgi:PAS domain S-box-containing protein
MAAAYSLDRCSSDHEPCPRADLIEFAGLALREEDGDALLRRAAALVARSLRVEHVEILEAAPDREALAVRARVGLGLADDMPSIVPGGAGSLAGYALPREEPVVAEDLAHEARFTDGRLLALRVASAVAVVVGGNGGGPFGVLAAASTRPRAFTAEELHCLTALADMLAGALHRIDVEETLRAAEARYRTLVESLPLVTYVDALDQTSSNIYTSPQIEPISGFSAEEWAEDPELFVKLLHPDDRERVLTEHDRLRQPGDHLSTEYRLVTRDERVVWVRDEAAVVQDAPDRPAYLQGVLMDVTEEKALGLQLGHSQRLEAVGRLAGGIAHDFNNLLTGIIGYAEFVLQSLGPSDPLHADVSEIATAGHRAAKLTRQLLAFSRKQVLEPRVVDLSHVVSEMEGLLRRVLGDGVELVVEHDPELGRIRADSGQLEQVLMNLVVNARDAMPEGGTIVIQTANVDLDDEYAHRQLVEAEPGRYVMLTVRDDGVGMEPETLERIFEPFFTTKDPAEGTGLGLSTVYGIIKQSGGFVWAYSEPGRGTVFRLYLPRSDDPAAAGAARAAVDEVRGGTETILVVEDDEFVRTLIARDLRRLGYTVATAADSQTAIDRVRSGLEADLLLTDVTTKGDDGYVLAAELRPLLPSCLVLFMTGYATSAAAYGADAASVIEKPFGPETLARRIRDVLDEGGARGR